MKSDFGQKLSENTGIRELMDDLDRALHGAADLRLLGGGNPARIPEIETLLRAAMGDLLADGDRFERMVGAYDGPRGSLEFQSAMAALLSRECGGRLGPENIAVTNGSQNAFFLLLNLLAGARAGAPARRILLPASPEYIGYADAGANADFFVAARPDIALLPERRFKYRLNFERIRQAAVERGPIAALLCSRPCNPSGNLIRGAELEGLHDLARELAVPLILDQAYGQPFPGITFVDDACALAPETILCLSLSKFGLPGLRTGVVAGPPEIIDALQSMAAITNLAAGSAGPALALALMRRHDLAELSRRILQPYYRARVERAAGLFLDATADLPGVRLHVNEGAFFLWVWCEGLPIDSRELYERIKARGTLVVPGGYFFPGLAENWPHRNECLRLSVARDPAEIEAGIATIAAEIRRAYHERRAAPPSAQPPGSR